MIQGQKHKIACIDITKRDEVKNIFGKKKVKLSVQDPPYNFIAFTEKRNDDFIHWCQGVDYFKPRYFR